MMKNFICLLTVSLLLMTQTLNAQWIRTSGPSGIVYSFLLSPDGTGGTNLFTGTASRGVFLSTDNGTSWTAVNKGASFGSVRTLAVSDTNLYAAAGSLYLSGNSGASWTRTALSGYNALTLAISDTNVFAGTAGGGVFRSSNNGKSWTAVNSGLKDSALLVAKLFVSDTCLFVGTWGGGLYRSTNNGASWTSANNGIVNHIHSFAVSTDGAGVKNLFVGTYFGDGIYLSTNNGANWNAIGSFGLTNKNIRAIVIYPNEAGGINLLAGTAGGGIFLSANNGKSWTLVSKGLTNFTINALLISGPYLFAGTGDGIWRRPLSDLTTDIISNGSTVKKLSSNQFKFTEGPVWYRDSVLLFTNEGPIICYDPVANKFSNWPNNSGGCNGLTCDKAGNLLGCSSNILMMNKAGKVIQTMASVYNSKRFNNPNDLIADHKGGVYFTDPDYFVSSPPQDKTAVYYIDPAGIVKRVIDELSKPNGLVLSPDGTRLYVVDSDNKYVYSWEVAADGSVSGKLSLAELQTTGGIASGADGMAIDIHGNIYVTSLMGIQVFSPQGDSLTTIVLPEIPSNCDFGGKDFKTLYITSHTSDFKYANLYSIDLNYPGYAVSRNPATAINSISKQSQLTIYPNPVQNVLHINIPGKAGMLEVFDITGKSVLQKQIQVDNPSLDVSGLVNGIYLLKIRSDKQMLTGKFVKQ